MKREELDFGEDLVQRGTITQEELSSAVVSARNKKQSLRKSLIDLKLLTSEMYDICRAEYFGIPYMALDTYFADPQALMHVPEEFARHELVFPLFQTETQLAVAVSDPTNLVTLDQLRADTGMEIDLYYAPDNAILEAIDRNYSEQLISSMSGRPGATTQQFDVPRLVDTLVQRAVREGASDIHIEPGRDHLLVRQRVDGVLVETNTLPSSLQANVISRVKIMAGLDISETRAPQDGHIALQVSGEDVALRVSTLPTLHGENVVIRLLIASKARIALDALGFATGPMDAVGRMIRRPYGMIVVTGPTGSGKTTTLYSILDQLNTVSKNIMTIEDPVEYTIDLLRQIQVNPKVGLNFSAGLRAILRQDPDIVMVGEIRDGETARVAVQAALTGHLVLSTLHTNDAASAVTRLMQMGVQPFLVASSLIGVIGQRLMRNACEQCREPYEPPEALRALLPDPNHDWFKPTGCDHCRQSGYRGRTGIYEVLEITPEIQSQVVRRAPANVYQEIARRNGMVTMFEDGAAKVCQGITTIEEVMAVAEASVPEPEVEAEPTP